METIVKSNKLCDYAGMPYTYYQLKQKGFIENRQIYVKINERSGLIFNQEVWIFNDEIIFNSYDLNKKMGWNNV